MRILFDNQCFYLHGKGGISRYISHLIKSLKEIDGVEVVFQPNEVYDFFIENKPFRQSSIKGLNRLRLERQKKKDLKFVRSQIKKTDWYFPTYYHPAFLTEVEQVKTGLIIHDMIHELFPNNSNNAQQHVDWKRSYINKAALFFTVSESTLNDLNELFPAAKGKSFRIYPGKFFKGVNSSPIQIPSMYYLFVGSRSFYKNFSLLLDKEIMSLLKNLICVGGGDFTAQEKAQIKKLGVGNSIIHLSPQQGELRYLYENTTAYISTSKYEGFGLPVLEAAELGVPLILWDSKVYREVSQKKATFFDSKAALLNILKSDQSMQDKVDCSVYDWDKTATQIVQELKKAKL